jgi:hypothetical protein
MWGNTHRVQAPRGDCALLRGRPRCPLCAHARCRHAGCQAESTAACHSHSPRSHKNTGSTRVAYQRAGCINPGPHRQADSTGTAGCRWAGRPQRAAPSTVPPPHLQGARKDTCMCTNACTRIQLPRSLRTHACGRGSRGCSGLAARGAYPIRRPPHTTQGRNCGRTTDRVCDWPNSDLPWSLL